MSATYNQILSLNPPEAGRTSSTVVPQSGTSFDSRNSQIIQFLIPPIAYLDGSSSYLSMDVTLNAITSGAVTGATTLTIDGPATSLFESATLYNSQNQVITEIRDFAQCSLHRVREKGFDYAATLGKNMLGLSSNWDAITSTSGDGTTMVTPYTTGGTGSQPTDLPGAITLAAGALAGAKTGTKINLAIPLEFFSGALCPAQQRYLPLHLMGSRSHALRLDIKMANTSAALVAFGSHATAATALTDAQKFDNNNTYYALDRVEMVCEYVNLGKEVDDQVSALAEQGLLEYKFTDYTTRKLQMSNASDTFFSFQNSKFTMSLKSVAAQFRANTAALTFPQITATQRANVTGFQIKVGSQYYPNKRIELPSVGTGSFNASAYAEVSKQAKSLSSIHGHGNLPYFNLVNGHGVEFGVDMSSKQASGASHDESLTLSGKNTTSGSSQVECRIDRSGAAPQTYVPEITVIFESDNVVRCANGVAVPVERS